MFGVVGVGMVVVVFGRGGEVEVFVLFDVGDVGDFLDVVGVVGV